VALAKKTGKQIGFIDDKGHNNPHLNIFSTKIIFRLTHFKPVSMYLAFYPLDKASFKVLHRNC
jgi:hypothetical protein